MSNFDAFYERLCEENGYSIEPCTEDPPAERLVTPSEGVQPSADDMWYITAWNALPEGVRARISRYSERLGSLLAGSASFNEAKSRLEDLKSSAKPFVVTHTDEEDRKLKEEWDGHGVLDHAPTRADIESTKQVEEILPDCFEVGTNSGGASPPTAKSTK